MFQPRKWNDPRGWEALIDDPWMRKAPGAGRGHAVAGPEVERGITIPKVLHVKTQPSEQATIILDTTIHLPTLVLPVIAERVHRTTGDPTYEAATGK